MSSELIRTASQNIGTHGGVFGPSQAKGAFEVNIAQSHAQVRSERRWQTWPLIVAFTVGVVGASILGAVNADAPADSQAATSAPVEVSQAVPSPADTEAQYREAEQRGLVPDEVNGGFREPANLRERLQAERGEFSASFR